MKIGWWLPALLFLGALPAPAEEFHNQEAGDVYVDSRGLALGGFDAVAYLEEDRALQGVEEHSTEHRGARYRFVSAGNLARFRAAPERYLPAFGGWCAFGFAMDREQFAPWKPGKYPVDPHTFKVIDGRLYLFYNREGFNALDSWNLDESAYLERARSTWKRMVSER